MELLLYEVSINLDTIVGIVNKTVRELETQKLYSPQTVDIYFL